MELMDRGSRRVYGDKIPEEELSSIDQDRFGVFPTTKRSLLIVTLFRAYLPCRGPLQRVVTIKLVSWKSNYHRYLGMPTRRRLKEDSQFCQVYQDIPSCNVTFEIDDNAVTENRFTEENVTEDTDRHAYAYCHQSTSYQNIFGKAR